jgi:hypothetical protein
MIVVMIMSHQVPQTMKETAQPTTSTPEKDQEKSRCQPTRKEHISALMY